LLVEARKQLVDQSVAGQLLAEQPQRLGIGDGDLRRQPEEPLERKSISHLVLSLVIGQVVQRLHHQHLEHQRDVVRLAPGVALALLLVNDLQQRAEGLPVDDAVETWQWIAQLLELGQPIFLVEKARLHAFRPLSVQLPLFCTKRAIFGGAHQSETLRSGR
jgi:hypothetical protein